MKIEKKVKLICSNGVRWKREKEKREDHFLDQSVHIHINKDIHVFILTDDFLGKVKMFVEKHNDKDSDTANNNLYVIQQSTIDIIVLS